MQHPNGRPSNRCRAREVNAFPLEMLRPKIESRMKQWRDFSGIGIDTCQVWTIMQIAVDAGESEVIDVITTSMELGDNMLDVQCRQR